MGIGGRVDYRRKGADSSGVFVLPQINQFCDVQIFILQGGGYFECIWDNIIYYGSGYGSESGDYTAFGISTVKTGFSDAQSDFFFVFFTMLFNGGIVPSYIMWTQIFHMKNTVWALILPGLLMNGFHVILMRNYFSQNIPVQLIEASKIDGAGEFKIFMEMILPLSLPIMATIGLFVGIGYWNDWTNGLYYVTKPDLYSLQNLLNRILQDVQFLSSSTVSQASGGNAAMTEMPSVSIRMAISVVGILPILVLYPFFQKYFVKGITVGAVKG